MTNNLRSTLRRIFYIYSEASVAALFVVGAIVELCCALGLPAPLSYFALGASALFALVVAHQVRYIVRSETTN